MGDDAITDRDKAGPADPSVELSSNRTAMSFERTAMSSDRTLMSVVRTSLSLIGFGFTIFQFFHMLNEKFLQNPLPTTAPRYFALALIALGILLLALGILNHRRETLERRKRRHMLFERRLILHPEIVKTSSAMSVAVLLLFVGIAALIDVGLRVGSL
jgi:putative membrane protein